MEPILKIENLQLSIGTAPQLVPILNGLSFQLNRNEVLGLVGASGSGKTMTLKSIIRLLETIPTYNLSGKIFYTDNRGENLELISANIDDLLKFRRSQVGVIFQQSAQVLNPSISIGDQIKERLELAGESDSIKNKEGVLELLDEVLLSPAKQYYNRYPHQLSGGQLQRALIAMALANNPLLLLADEPTFNLDKKTEQEIIDLLVSIKENRELSILFVSHDMELVNKFCDRIIYIKEGRIDTSGISRTTLQIPQNSKRDINDHITIVELRNITKVYEESSSLWHKKSLNTVLKNFSLIINEAQVVGLVGPSGFGKSTVAKIIAGIDDKYEGEYLLNGRNVQAFRKSDVLRMRQEVQIIFQDSYSAMPPHIRVIDLFTHIIDTYNLNLSKSDLIELLGHVGLGEELLGRLPGQLSGGQRQRLLIAKALLVKPKLLICDEIVSSLDDFNKSSVLKVIRELVENQGITILFISHEMKVVESVCDKIYTMSPL